ncbi:MAG: superoxide dismutase family protein [Oscillospiraceae bacterium]|nr:superoxide dismutase family protein [Oscillospiraceae bacterium]
MPEPSQLMRFLTTLRRRPDARAILAGDEDCPNIRGTVRFYQTNLGVLAAAEVFGLPVGRERCAEDIFAFHIHGGGSCTGNREDPFADAGTHYNPENCPHPAHAGDMPPLFANRDGYAFQVFLTDRFQVREILGRTVIIHADPDDFTTQPGGNAGRKIACGEIRPFPCR